MYHYWVLYGLSTSLVGCQGVITSYDPPSRHAALEELHNSLEHKVKTSQRLVEKLQHRAHSVPGRHPAKGGAELVRRWFGLKPLTVIPPRLTQCFSYIFMMGCHCGLKSFTPTKQKCKRWLAGVIETFPCRFGGSSFRRYLV